MRTQGYNKEGLKRQSPGVMDSGHTRKIGKDKEEQRNRRQRVSQRVRDKACSILQYREVKQSVSLRYRRGNFNCDSISHAHGPEELKLHTVTCNAGKVLSFPAFTFIFWSQSDQTGLL